MDAEIDYAKMCEICPCRKRRLEERDEEPAKKRKEVESEEQESDQPAADNKEADVEEDEDSKSEVSLVIAECDSDEEPEEVDPRDVEVESETNEGWVPGPESRECCCAEPLAAIKQAFDEWIA